MEELGRGYAVVLRALRQGEPAGLVAATDAHGSTPDGVDARMPMCACDLAESTVGWSTGYEGKRSCRLRVPNDH